MRWASLVALTACAAPAPADEARHAYLVNTLADDNYVWARREPAVVAMKLVKMQRSPFEWLRGTAAVYWHDLNDPGAPRAATAFGDPASSRVLLQGDPHPENFGTFRATDGTMLVELNDFDAAGYGPFEGDLRRLAAGLVLATGNDDLARAAAEGYADEIATADLAPVGEGASPYLDKQIAKAIAKGDAHAGLDELAPVGADGARHVAFGDVEPVADDGVIENRYVPVGADLRALLDEAVAQYRPDARIQLVARHLGSGVSSYAALRFAALLDDGSFLEPKEERDGVVVHGVPELQVGAWPSPSARTVDAQRRMQARRDADPLLGDATLGGLSLRVTGDEKYQRGVNADDLAALDADEQAGVARVLGGLLARSHGQALTEDGVRGFDAIAPLVADEAFLDEVVTLALADAGRTRADYELVVDEDLASLVLP